MEVPVDLISFFLSYLAITYFKIRLSKINQEISDLLVPPLTLSLLIVDYSLLSKSILLLTWRNIISLYLYWPQNLQENLILLQLSLCCSFCISNIKLLKSFPDVIRVKQAFIRALVVLTLQESF